MKCIAIFNSTKVEMKTTIRNKDDTKYFPIIIAQWMKQSNRILIDWLQSCSNANEVESLIQHIKETYPELSFSDGSVIFEVTECKAIKIITKGKACTTLHVLIAIAMLTKTIAQYQKTSMSYIYDIAWQCAIIL